MNSFESIKALSNEAALVGGNFLHARNIHQGLTLTRMQLSGPVVSAFTLQGISPLSQLSPTASRD